MSGNIYVNILRDTIKVKSKLEFLIDPIYSQNVCDVCEKKHHRKRAQREICVNGNEKIFLCFFAHADYRQ
jgi:hypothetical protein